MLIINSFADEILGKYTPENFTTMRNAEHFIMLLIISNILLVYEQLSH